MKIYEEPRFCKIYEQFRSFYFSIFIRLVFLKQKVDYVVKHLTGILSFPFFIFFLFLCCRTNRNPDKKGKQ